MIQAVRDISEKHPSSGENIVALDGVRGVAVLFVLTAHTGAFLMAAQGQVGVWLFFALSAFLLTLPFARDPDRIFRDGVWWRYAKRRLLRILPLYYAIVVLHFFYFSFKPQWLLMHFAFLRGDGIWWSIPQEMLFYALLPLLVASHVWLFRRSVPATCLGLALLAVLANVFLTPEILPMRASQKDLPFYFGIFAAGMAFSYAYHHAPWMEVLKRPAINRSLSVLGFGLLATLIFTAPPWHDAVLSRIPVLRDLPSWVGVQYPGTFGTIGAMLVFVSVACEGRAINRLFRLRFLRALGVVSFGFYLIHFPILMLLQLYGMKRGIGLFALTLVITYVISAAVYGMFERPILRWGRSRI